METAIKLLARDLRIQYYIFWMLPVLLVLVYELDGLSVGLFAADEGMQYVLETAGILVAVCCIPLSLKLFSLVLNKKIDRATLPEALRLYRLWSVVRLSLLEMAVLFNLIVYYLTLQNVGGLCALAALTASVFCLPSEKRMREELHIVSAEG